MIFARIGDGPCNYYQKKFEPVWGVNGAHDRRVYPLLMYVYLKKSVAFFLEYFEKSVTFFLVYFKKCVAFLLVAFKGLTQQGMHGHSSRF